MNKVTLTDKIKTMVMEAFDEGVSDGHPMARVRKSSEILDYVEFPAIATEVEALEKQNQWQDDVIQEIDAWVSHINSSTGIEICLESHPEYAHWLEQNQKGLYPAPPTTSQKEQK